MAPTETKATPHSSARDPKRRALELKHRRARARDDLDAMPGLRGTLELFFGNLEAELDDVIPPLYVTPHPSEQRRREEGIYFSTAEVRRFIEFCCRLRHVKGGKFAGQRLLPDLWQNIQPPRVDRV